MDLERRCPMQGCLDVASSSVELCHRQRRDIPDASVRQVWDEHRTSMTCGQADGHSSHWANGTDHDGCTATSGGRNRNFTFHGNAHLAVIKNLLFSPKEYRQYGDCGLYCLLYILT